MHLKRNKKTISIVFLTFILNDIFGFWFIIKSQQTCIEHMLKVFLTPVRISTTKRTGTKCQCQAPYHVSATNRGNTEVIDGSQHGPEAAGLLGRDAKLLRGVHDSSPGRGSLRFVLDLKIC